MADLVYDGSGRSGGGSYNVSPGIFGDNSYNGGGYVSLPTQRTNEQKNFYAQQDYFSLTKRYADSSFDNSYFANHPNTANPYIKTYTRFDMKGSTTWGKIEASGNEYTRVKSALGIRGAYDYTITNNAYTDFENKATAAKNTYLSQNQAAINEAKEHNAVTQDHLQKIMTGADGTMAINPIRI